MKDVINIEMVDNGLVLHGEDFSQVIEGVINQDENIFNVRFGTYFYSLLRHSIYEFGSCKIKVEINITNAEV